MIDVGARHAVAGDVGGHARHELGRLAGILEALFEASRARSSAGSMNLSSRSCSVTLRPRCAHQAAMSPPMTPAPTTCTRSSGSLRLAAEILQPILQHEHAHQVARGLADHELGDRARFGLVGALRRARRASPTGR